MKRTLGSDKLLWTVKLLMVLLPFIFGNSGYAQDTLARGPKHYFNSTFWFNWYGSGAYAIDNEKIDTLGNYSFSQGVTSFYIPVCTKDIHKKEGTVIANRHLLITGSFLKARPHFSNLASQHTLFKSSVGIRYIYNNGEKNIWFFDFSPFVTGDNTVKTGHEFRMASVLVFNRTVNHWFSFKLGITKTFLFGDRLHLPVIGIRLGKLDGVYASFTFPRNISVNVPVGKKFCASMYAKPMGGIYNFANSAHLNDGRDTLIYSGLSADSNYIIFGRLEYLSGLKLEYTPSSYFSVYAGAGVTLFNWMGFASYQQNREKLERIKPFASEPLEGARGFIQFGLTLRLGKTKKMAGNTQMYEVFHLNNTFDPGDNNSDPGGGNNPVNRKEKDIKRLSYKDIEDLVEDGEF